MGAFDKLLQFFGLKEPTIVIPVADQDPLQNQHTKRDDQSDWQRPTPAAPNPTPSPGGYSRDPSAAQRDDELRRAREERERVRREREALEAEKRALEIAQAGRSADPAPPAASASVHEQEPTTGGRHVPRSEPHAAGGPAAPDDGEKTVNPMLAGPRNTSAVKGVLIPIEGPNVGSLFGLGDGTNVIGRAWSGSTVAVPLKNPDSTISREHCEIDASNERFVLTPRMTSNEIKAEVFVDDRKVEEKALLRDGATLKIHGNVLRFRTVAVNA